MKTNTVIGLFVGVGLLAILCSSTAFPAEPTNRAERLLADVSAHRISLEEGKRECIALIDSASNLPTRVETAATFARLCERHSPGGLSEKETQERLADYKTAIETTLPLLDRLDAEHRQSLAALNLSFELSKMLFETAHVVKDATRKEQLRVRSLECLEDILNADETLLVPEGKVLAEDEDLELEKAWAKKELKKLQGFASAKIVYHLRPSTGDPFAFKEDVLIRQLMDKYADNATVQRVGNERLKDLAQWREQNAEAFKRRRALETDNDDQN